MSTNKRSEHDNEIVTYSFDHRCDLHCRIIDTETIGCAESQRDQLHVFVCPDFFVSEPVVTYEGGEASPMGYPRLVDLTT